MTAVSVLAPGCTSDSQQNKPHNRRVPLEHRARCATTGAAGWINRVANLRATPKMLVIRTGMSNPFSSRPEFQNPLDTARPHTNNRFRKTQTRLSSKLKSTTVEFPEKYEF